MSTLTHPLQHISGKDHDRHLRRHEGIVSIGGRPITNLHFANNIDGLAGEEEELAKLVERLDNACTAYGMDQYREDHTDDKQHQWHQHRDQSEWTEA